MQCGNPTEKSNCNVCGSQIGGVDNVYNKLQEGNRLAQWYVSVTHITNNYYSP